MTAGLQSPSVRTPTTKAVAESGPFWCTSPARLEQRAAAAAAAEAKRKNDSLNKELKRQEKRRERMLKLTEEMASVVRQKKPRLQRQKRWQRKKTGGEISAGEAVSGMDGDDVASIETSMLSSESREDDRGSEGFGSNASFLDGGAVRGNGGGNEKANEKPLSSSNKSSVRAINRIFSNRGRALFGFQTSIALRREGGVISHALQCVALLPGPSFGTGGCCVGSGIDLLMIRQYRVCFLQERCKELLATHKKKKNVDMAIITSTLNLPCIIVLCAALSWSHIYLMLLPGAPGEEMERDGGEGRSHGKARRAEVGGLESAEDH